MLSALLNVYGMSSGFAAILLTTIATAGTIAFVHWDPAHLMKERVEPGKPTPRTTMAAAMRRPQTPNTDATKELHETETPAGILSEYRRRPGVGSEGRRFLRWASRHLRP